MPSIERSWLDDAVRLPATLLGLTPLVAVSLISTALLWGTGYDLPAQVDQLSDLRAAVAWLAFVSLLLIVAYPVLGYVVRILRGDWPSFPVRRVLDWAIRRHQRRRDRELAWLGRWDGTDNVTEVRSAIAWNAGEIAMRYPLPDRRIGPTLLGNVEAAVVDRVWRRYGLSLKAAWPRLAALQAEADRVHTIRAKHRADAAAFVTAGWALATAFLVISGAAVLPSLPLALLIVAGAMVGAMFCRIAYREAVVRAVVLGRLIESVTDLHRFDLLDSLGWPRPATPEEERELFMALSGWLVRGYVESSFRYESPAGDERFAARLDRLTSSLEDTVGQAVRSGVDSSVNTVLPSVVERTLLRSLTGPTLDNFDGHLSAALLEGGEVVLPADDEGRLRVDTHSRYDLQVAIDTQPLQGGVSAPLRIRGGNDRPAVTFGVSVDSNVPTLRIQEEVVVVRKATGWRQLFAVDLAGVDVREPWLWVRVTQHGRTVQNLHLALATAVPPT